jgi:hypothetical protein
MKLKFIFFIILCCALSQTKAQEIYLNRCNQALINTIVEDIFSPPVASRIHVYANIAAYEVLTKKFKSLRPLAGQIKHLKPIPLPTQKVDFSVAAEVAFVETGKKMIYTEYMLDDFLSAELDTWKKSIKDTSLISSSVQYGKAVAAHMIQWLLDDNYTYTRTLERYVLSDSLGAWKPTAPEYMNGLEPNWSMMRSLVSETPDYVRAVPNLAYSEEKSSMYYKNALDVYNTSIKKDSTLIKTALYWDDNPNTAVVNGHLTYFIHKVTPGGHWLKITGQMIRNKKLSEDKAAELYAMVSIGLYEGFLSCWNEKYKSNSVRPETYINRLIDAKWLPLIETPPFPEYTSGHSAVSATASSFLTHFIPQPCPFTDSSQLYLSLAPRKYKSFREASDEASISRFYGGIHYMPSLDNGAKQGREVVQYILKKIKTRQ